MPLPELDSRTIIYELCRRSSDDIQISQSHKPLDIDHNDQCEYDPDSDPSGPNNNVVAYSPALTSALACNTATYTLGNTAQAKATCFYLVKYITKDATALTNSLSCLMEAKQCIEQYPSRSEDTGTQTRTAMHLITRTLNNLSAKMEISAAMASASLLGLPATVSSHDFWYVFIWPAVKAAKQSQHENNIAVDIDNDNNITSDLEHDNLQNNKNVSDVLLEGQDSLFDDIEIEVDEPTVGEIHFNKHGHVTIVPQHIHYQFRGEELKDFCLYDYAGCVTVAKKKSKLNSNSDVEQNDDTYEECDDLTPAMHGRHKNKKFPFNARHPLFDTHEQRLRSKQFVPILAGAPPPIYPGVPNMSNLWKSAAKQYAEYMLCAFVPWDLETMAPPMFLTWENFCTWADQHTQKTENTSANHFIENCRFNIVQNISRNMRVSSEQKKLIVQWRSRSATEWRGQPGEPKQFTNLDKDSNVNESCIAADEEMEQFIEQLRREHGADISHVNSRVQNQQTYETATLALLSGVFDNNFSEHFSTNISKPSYITPILDCSQHEINEVLQKNFEPDSIQSPSDLSLLRGQENIPVQQIDQPCIINVSPSSHLNDEQNNALIEVLSWLADKQHHDTDPVHALPPEQLLMLICGAPGVGKSFFGRELISCIDIKIILCAAPTGIAASELFKGRTLHDLLGFPTTSARPKILPPLRLDRAALLSARLQNIHILLIDEISMVDDLFFSWIDQRLQQLLHNTASFGGLGIIAMGDFLQLPPVIGTSLFKAALNGTTPGGLLFRKLKLYTFEEQMRAAEDTIHTANINSFRTNSNPVTTNFLSTLQPLTAADVIEDSSWRQAPIVVTSNSERMAI